MVGKPIRNTDHGEDQYECADRDTITISTPSTSRRDTGGVVRQGTSANHPLEQEYPSPRRVLADGAPDDRTQDHGEDKGDTDISNEPGIPGRRDGLDQYDGAQREATTPAESLEGAQDRTVSFVVSPRSSTQDREEYLAIFSSRGMIQPEHRTHSWTMVWAPAQPAEKAMNRNAQSTKMGLRPDKSLNLAKMTITADQHIQASSR